MKLANGFDLAKSISEVCECQTWIHVWDFEKLNYTKFWASRISIILDNTE